MNTMNGKLIGGLVLGLTAGLVLAGSLHRADAAPRDAVAERLQRSKTGSEILELMATYGATLDRRDFAAFSKLFTEDATYGGGAATSLTRGRDAIASMLEKAITTNTANLPGPNSHLYFNPSIQVDGDRATAQQQGRLHRAGQGDQGHAADLLHQLPGHVRSSRRTLAVPATPAHELNW